MKKGIWVKASAVVDLSTSYVKVYVEDSAVLAHPTMVQLKTSSGDVEQKVKDAESNLHEVVIQLVNDYLSDVSRDSQGRVEIKEWEVGEESLPTTIDWHKFFEGE